MYENPFDKLFNQGGNTLSHTWILTFLTRGRRKEGLVFNWVMLMGPFPDISGRDAFRSQTIPCWT